MNELQEALSVETDPHDTELLPDLFDPPDQLIDGCQSLVEFDEDSGTVRFTHYTLQQFLEKEKEHYCPRDLAKVCLTYLTFDVFELGPCPDKQSFDQRLKTHRFSDYAVRYWAST